MSSDRNIYSHHPTFSGNTQFYEFWRTIKRHWSYCQICFVRQSIWGNYDFTEVFIAVLLYFIKLDKCSCCVRALYQALLSISCYLIKLVPLLWLSGRSQKGLSKYSKWRKMTLDYNLHLSLFKEIITNTNKIQYAQANKVSLFVLLLADGRQDRTISQPYHLCCLFKKNNIMVCML